MSTSTVDKGDDGKTRRPSTATSTKSEEKTVDVASVATTDTSTTATELVVAATPAEEKGAIQLMQPSVPLPNNRPIGVTGLQVIDIIHVAGSDRPITAGKQKVSEMFHSAGERPVMAATLKVSEVFNIAGDRPVMAGTLKISEIYSSMGTRPVASNEIDDAVSLMGFLD